MLNETEPDEITQKQSLLELEEEEQSKANSTFTFEDDGRVVDEEMWAFHKEVKELLWNSKVDLAEEMIETRKEENLLYAILYAEIAFWRFNFDQTDERFEDVQQRLSIIDNMSRVLVEKYRVDRGIVNRFFGSTKEVEVDEATQYALYTQAVIGAGFAKLGSAMINFRNQNLVKGAYYMQRGWVEFTKAEDLMKVQESKGFNPNQKMLGVVRFCMGLFHFGASMIPPRFKWVGNILGFAGDRDQALTEIQFSVDADTSISIEATLALIGLKKFFFDEEQDALRMLDEIMAKFPESAVMWYMHGFFLRGMGQIDNSIQSFHKSFEFGGDIEHLRLTANYHLGYTYFLKNEWGSSAENFKTFLDNAEVVRFKPYSCYILGYCYWKLGEPEKITEYYSRIGEWVRPNQSFDEFAQKKVAKFLENNGFTEFDDIYIAASALHEGKFEKQALRKIEEVIPILKADKQNRDIYALYYFLKGSILKALGKGERAVDMLKRACQNAELLSPDALYAVPYSLCDLAEYEIDNNNLKVAEQYLKTAKTYKNYDWERIVSVKISSFQQKIAKKKKNQ